MNQTEIRNSALARIRGINRRLIELQILLDEWSGVGASELLALEKGDGHAFRVENLEMTVKMLRAMVMDFENDLGKLSDRYELTGMRRA